MPEENGVEAEGKRVTSGHPIGIWQVVFESIGGDKERNAADRRLLCSIVLPF